MRAALDHLLEVSMSQKSTEQMARDHAKEAIGVLHEIMVSPEAENKDRLRAAETLLDRGHGKAVSAVISVPLAKRQQQAMASMTDEELMAAIRETPLPRLTGPELFTCHVAGCPGDHSNELELCGEFEVEL